VTREQLQRWDFHPVRQLGVFNFFNFLVEALQVGTPTTTRGITVFFCSNFACTVFKKSYIFLLISFSYNLSFSVYLIDIKINVNKILIYEVKLWDPIQVFYSCTIGVKNE
jgi:hypothetical protein